MDTLLVNTKIGREHNLTGNELLVLSLIMPYCEKYGTCTINYKRLAFETCCGDETTASRIVSKLELKGLLAKTKTGVCLGPKLQNVADSLQIAVEQPANCSPKPAKCSQNLQNAADLKERTKENNNSINNSNYVCNNNETHTNSFDESFNLFWSNYDPDNRFHSWKHNSYKIFQTLPQDWKHLAIKHAANHKPGRAPLYFLQDEDFLQIEDDLLYGPKDQEQAFEPHWLTPDEQDELYGQKKMVCCKNPKTGKFGLLLKSEWELLNPDVYPLTPFSPIR